MTKLTIEDLYLDGAEIGVENPLPPIGTRAGIKEIPLDPKAPAEMKANMARGHKTAPLPYTIQDGYSRTKKRIAMKTAVLENDALRATFALQYGGRLWSLFDKTRDRELLYRNPVFQPANLSIRNAWFSGGVEWNIGLRGHSPFTCSDVFAARVEAEDRTPILRLYEYERIRQVPYQIDFILPNGSEQLYVYVRITNPHGAEVPMYWWSNIAFPEHERTRVVVPAEQAFRFGYGRKGLALKPIPEIEGIDVTHSTNLGHSADFFFDIDKKQRKWISAIDEAGAGLFQASTDRLIGRKLFVWGSGPGGHAWQEFLAVPGKPYIEIQAGLARTQMEHVAMPGRTQWDWLEAYGAVQADPEAVHGDNWQTAYTEVGNAIDAMLPESVMRDRHESARASADTSVAEVLHRGSGWGQLENDYRKVNDQKPLVGDALDFSHPLQPGQTQWRDLLRLSTFPCPDPLAEPVGYEVEPKWISLLEKYVESTTDNWYAWLHLGLALFDQERLEEAAKAWERSSATTENPWALRNLAKLESLNGNLNESVDLYAKAYAHTHDCFPLTVEYGTALLAAGLPGRWLAAFAELPDEVQQNGRMQLLFAQGLLGTGELDRAKAIVEAGPRVNDLREGENSLTDVWYRIHEKIAEMQGVDVGPDEDLRSYVEKHYPPPARIDFRMRTKPSKI
jgi:tetratricopeptide (TPR) repeat protein